MKVFFNNRFRGHYPVGTAAVVVAETREMACCLLAEKLIEHGLKDGVVLGDMIEVPTTGNQVFVLNDGNY